MAAISGFVRDADGVPAVRELRFYRRDTGALLGKTYSSTSADTGDTHYEQVSILLHFDGTDGSTSFVDSSPRVKTPTAHGSAIISTDYSKFGSGALRLNGTGYVSVPASNDFKFGAGDFSVELSCKPDASSLTGDKFLLAQQSSDGVWSTANSGIELYLNNGVLRARFHYGGSAVSLGAVTPLQSTGFHEIYIGRSGDILYIGVDGVLNSTSIGTTTLNDVDVPLVIGRLGDVNSSQFYFSGRIDELRITKGVARHTENYVPSTEPYPDTPSSGGVVTPGAYYFSTSYTGEVQVICLDDDSGALENDYILRTFPV